MSGLLQLAIDSSASRPAAAILRGEQVLADWLGPGNLKHHETLLTGVDTVLKQAGIALADLAFLSVGIGPGMFTGLRIGVVTAKFLADPLGIPCVPVSSLIALALQSQKVGGPAKVWALSDARSKRVYSLGLDHFSPDFSPPEGEEIALPPEEAAKPMRAGDLLLGEGAQLYRDLWPAGTILLPEDTHALKAGTVGFIGAKRFALGLSCSATELEPKYLKTGQPHL
jgi:tRNA threonylcarbamoyladenosine biosynthesis protein TsaB